MVDTDRGLSPLGQGQDGVVVMNSRGTGLLADRSIPRA
jgi:hypothetical protein